MLMQLKLCKRQRQGKERESEESERHDSELYIRVENCQHIEYSLCLSLAWRFKAVSLRTALYSPRPLLLTHREVNWPEEIEGSGGWEDCPVTVETTSDCAIEERMYKEVTGALEELSCQIVKFPRIMTVLWERRARTQEFQEEREWL